jgi:hypothetical protein
MASKARGYLAQGHHAALTWRQDLLCGACALCGGIVGARRTFGLGLLQHGGTALPQRGRLRSAREGLGGSRGAAGTPPTPAR